MAQVYEGIVAWQRADDLAVSICGATEEFPRSELCGLVSQMRRAAVSVPANIAEGSARQYLKQHLHFLHPARSSLTELAYHSHLRRRLGFVDESAAAKLSHLRDVASPPLYGLISWVEEQIESGQVLNRKPVG
ncbi:MAG: hypothetical protein AMJ93_01220 [Anaerolineae bacterium SM23_84]|nr:MAG: hypothetical protein AMJ93_01220 [Anaerolineae bacterium SM23_84]